METKGYAEVFQKFLSEGEQGLDTDEKKMLLAGASRSTENSGYLIPKDVFDRIDQARRDFSTKPWVRPLRWFEIVMPWRWSKRARTQPPRGQFILSVRTEDGAKLEWPTLSK